MKFVILIAALLSVGAVQAASFDLAADFPALADVTPANNPNGVWSYGGYSSFDDPDAFVLFTETTVRGPNVEGWRLPPGNLSATYFVAKNFSNTLFAPDPGTVVYPAGSVIVHPRQNGEQVVVRFTAPSSGKYEIDAEFAAGDTATLSDAQIFVSGSQSSATTLGDVTAGQMQEFSDIFHLIGGDTVDFVVGWGSNNNFFSDSTLLQVTISQVPLPAAAWLMLPALAGLGRIARQKPVRAL
ncbi:MAG: VPLPA-CTERM sorting domain-containing protein [Pseudomonadota bacterium]